jgi:hypothetical protein
MTTNANDAIAIQRKYYTQNAARYEEMHGSEGSGDPFQMDFVATMLRMLQVNVYDSFDQIVHWGDRVIVVPSDKIKPASWMHPLLTSPGVILCAIRER